MSHKTIRDAMLASLIRYYVNRINLSEIVEHQHFRRNTKAV